MMWCETKPGSGRHPLCCSWNGESTRRDYSEGHHLHRSSIEFKKGEGKPGSDCQVPEHYLLLGFLVMEAMLHDCSSGYLWQCSEESSSVKKTSPGLNEWPFRVFLTFFCRRTAESDILLVCCNSVLTLVRFTVCLLAFVKPVITRFIPSITP